MHCLLIRKNEENHNKNSEKWKLNAVTGNYNQENFEETEPNGKRVDEILSLV